MTYTPGPWKAYHTPDDRWIVDQPGPNGLHVVYCGPGSNLYSEANAHLIAAAPDGLEFARAVTEWMANLGPDNMSSLTAALYEQGLTFIAQTEGRES